MTLAMLKNPRYINEKKKWPVAVSPVGVRIATGHSRYVFMMVCFSFQTEQMRPEVEDRVPEADDPLPEVGGVVFAAPLAFAAAAAREWILLIFKRLSVCQSFMRVL